MAGAQGEPCCLLTWGKPKLLPHPAGLSRAKAPQALGLNLLQQHWPWGTHPEREQEPPGPILVLPQTLRGRAWGRSCAVGRGNPDSYWTLDLSEKWQ